MKLRKNMSSVEKGETYSFINMKKIKEALNGFGVIIEYQNYINIDPTSYRRFSYKDNFLQAVFQGQFTCGNLEGFGRIIDNIGNMQQGFYSTIVGQEIGEEDPKARPFGKWMHVNKDLVNLSPLGIYRGDEEVWDRVFLE